MYDMGKNEIVMNQLGTVKELLVMSNLLTVP